MTQRLGARSGRLLRPRRGHQLPAGPGQQRLHPDHGLEHGRGPPRRLPLADEGPRERGARSSTSTRASAAPARCARPVRRHPRRQRHRVPRRDHQLHPDPREVVQGVRAGVHQRLHDHRGRVPGHRRPGRHLQRLRPREARVRRRQGPLGLRRLASPTAKSDGKTGGDRSPPDQGPGGVGPRQGRAAERRRRRRGRACTATA